MKFSHFVELITIIKPTDEFYLKISYIFSYLYFTGLASTINAEFEIIFLMRSFSYIESLIDV